METIVEALAPFLTGERAETLDRILSQRISSVSVALERPYDIHNGLAVVRTAEALGVHHLHFINAQMKKGQGRGTTKGTLKWTHLHKHPSLDTFLEMKGEKLLVGAAADGAHSLETLPLDRPLCFLFGNEKEGMSEEAKEACDLLFHIPMFGMVESYNLSVAAAITLYDYLQRKRAFLKREGDLSGKELLEEKAYFYVRSVGIEQSLKIVKRYLT
ncbi:MAG: RNA methyltransferase [Chlamydiia bacterium]|nr:RNA methyltransferase [Chlamydiia bacterium]